MKVQLTSAEMLQAAQAGVLRQVESHYKGRTNWTGNRLDYGQWTNHIEGAAAEMAVAKVLGTYWPGKGEISEPDLRTPDGCRHEVRWTGRREPALRVMDKDDDEMICWLVTGACGTYEVHGYIGATQARQIGTRSDEYGGCYHVSPGELNHGTDAET